MNERASQEVDEPMTREALLASLEALKLEGVDNPLSEAAEGLGEGEGAQAAEPGSGDVEDLAEAQDSNEGDEEGQEAVLGKMSAADFARDTGITLEELYRDVMLKRGEKEVSISQTLDEYTALETANAALTREREELVKKVSQVNTQPPPPGMAPQVQQLLARAQMYQELMANPGTFEGMEAGQAANAKLEIQQSVQQLMTQAQMVDRQHQQAMSQQMAQVREASDRAMRAKVPEWADAAIKEDEQRQIKDMAAKYGFRPEEIDKIYDPRARLMLRDLLKTSQTTKRVEAGAKKLKKLSRTLEPGSRQTPKKSTLKDLGAKLRDPKLSRAERSKLILTSEFGE